MLKQCLEIKAKGCCMHVFLVLKCAWRISKDAISETLNFKLIWKRKLKTILLPAILRPFSNASSGRVIAVFVQMYKFSRNFSLPKACHTVHFFMQLTTQFYT